MIKFEKKQVKIISILIALVFVGSVVALALTQSGSGIVSAAGNSNVGTVDYRQIMAQHPGLQKANEDMQAELANAQKEFEEKSKDMNDQQKEEYYAQTQQRLQQKQKDLIEPMENSVEEAVKKVADARGLTVVIDKNAVVYGGQDITQEVIGKISK